MRLDVQPFDPRHGSAGQYAAYHAFDSRIRAERAPEDPIPSLEQFTLDLQNIPPIVDVYIRLAWDEAGGRIIADASAGVMTTGDNEHLVQIDIRVLPEYRRQGIGTELLHYVAELAESTGRRVLMALTHGTVPAGAAFLERVGAQVGLAQHVNELILAGVDADLIRDWQERAAERASGFDLGLWDGRYPEIELDAIAHMHEAINTVPTGTLDVEDFHFSADKIRAMDDAMDERGLRRWTLFARERETGAIAGFTELMWRDSQPELGHQGITAVFPAYRNRGLGRWLKAAMVAKALRELPAMTRIKTENADSNAAMLRINEELGFHPTVSLAIWQAELVQVQGYLSERRESVVGSPSRL